MKNTLSLLAGILTHACMALALNVGAANATVLYNNLGAGDAFDTGIGWTIDSFSQGMQFSPTATGLMTSVDVGMGVDDASPPRTVNFSLYADSEDTLGTLLETFSIVVNNAFGTLGTSSGITSGSTLLTAGDWYWLVAVSADGTNIPWNLNSTGDVGFRYNAYFDEVNGDTLGAFRINSEVSVPEPTSLALLGIGLTGLVVMRRRKEILT